MMPEGRRNDARTPRGHQKNAKMAPKKHPKVRTRDREHRLRVSAGGSPPRSTCFRRCRRVVTGFFYDPAPILSIFPTRDVDPIKNETAITLDGQITKTIELSSGEEANLIIRGPHSLEKTVKLVGVELDVSLDLPKSVNSLIGSYCNAKQDDEFEQTSPLELMHDIRGSQITITCPDHTDWQKNYRPSENILFNFLELFVNNHKNVEPLAASIVQKDLELSKDSLDSFDGRSWYRGDGSIWSDDFIDSRKKLFDKISSKSIPLSFCKLTEMEPEISHYAKEISPQRKKKNPTTQNKYPHNEKEISPQRKTNIPTTQNKYPTTQNQPPIPL